MDRYLDSQRLPHELDTTATSVPDPRMLTQQIHQTQQHLAQLQNLVHSGGFQAQQPLRQNANFPQQQQRLGGQHGANNSWVTGDPQLLRLVQTAGISVRERNRQAGPEQVNSPMASAISSVHMPPGALQFSAHPTSAPMYPPDARSGQAGMGQQQGMPPRSLYCAAGSDPYHIGLGAEQHRGRKAPTQAPHYPGVRPGALHESVISSSAAAVPMPLSVEHSVTGIYPSPSASALLPPRPPAPFSPASPLSPLAGAAGDGLSVPHMGEGVRALSKRGAEDGGEEGDGKFKLRKVSFGGVGVGAGVGLGSGQGVHGEPWGVSQCSTEGVGGQAGAVRGKRVRGGVCEHGVPRSACKACGGTTLCEHGRQRSRCRDCGGSGVCEHGRQRGTCKECGGSQICEHNRRRSLCKDCGGSQICAHNRQRSYCKDCKGSGVCEHNRRRSSCKECGGSGICVHRRLRRQCKECGGSSICEHGRQRSLCKDCGGSQICEHGKRRKQCRECLAATAAAAAAQPVQPEPQP